jgi:hypothetical protein
MALTPPSLIVAILAREFFLDHLSMTKFITLLLRHARSIKFMH